MPKQENKWIRKPAKGTGVTKYEFEYTNQYYPDMIILRNDAHGVNYPKYHLHQEKKIMNLKHYPIYRDLIYSGDKLNQIKEQVKKIYEGR